MEKLDKKDKKILEVLDINGRASVSEVSRKVGLPRDSVHYRIQKLIKNKFIKFFHAVVDPVKLGYPVYTYVSFVLQGFDQDREDKFYEYLQNNPNIVYVAKTTGKWDCLIAVSARNLEHFESIFKEIRRKFSDILKDFETASIIKEYKYDSMVGLVD